MDSEEVADKIVRRFLLTVAVVDDQPVYSPPQVDPVSAEQAEPAVTRLGRKSRLPPPAVLRVPVAEVPSGDAAHDFPAERAAKAFVSEGMLCAVVKPPSWHDLETLPAPLGIRRADVVVLDWKLASGEPTGRSAIRLVSRLVDPKQGQPIRLVCIYTAEPDIEGIAAQLAEACFVEPDNKYELRVGGTRVAVLGKPGNTSCPDNRKATAEELPEKVIAEFRHAVEGLVPGFAVAALGAIREHSGHLLARFHADVDPALLGQRILLPNPQDSTEQLTNSLSDELNAIVVADELVEASTADQQCEDRAEKLMSAVSDIKGLAARFQDSSDVKKDVVALVRDGIGSPKKNDSKWTTRLFAMSDQAFQSDLDLAAILQSRRHYSNSAPILTLGVVVERITDGKTGLPKGIYLCLQPFCDSVHFTGARSFPFLPLNALRSIPPNFVVSDGTRARSLSVKTKLLHLCHARFTPTTDLPGSIRAVKLHGDWIFRAAKGSRVVYRYVGRLREPHAQRLAHDLGTSASRIGVDDPEWLRLGRLAGIPSGTTELQSEGD